MVVRRNPTADRTLKSDVWLFKRLNVKLRTKRVVLGEGDQNGVD